MAQLSRRFYLRLISKCSPTTLWQHAAKVWAFPFSLATTWGIIIIFFSSSYLDVSVQRVDSPCGVLCLQHSGCPIRKSSDLMLVCSSPKLIAAYHVLLRLLESRHPPYALICFKKFEICSYKKLQLLFYKNFQYYNFYFPNMSKNLN